jgi:flagellar biosynthesis/type III secretory pathway protein FliH
VRSSSNAILFTAPPTSITIVPEVVERIPEIPDTRVTLEDHEAAVAAAHSAGYQEANELLTRQILEQREETTHLQESVFRSLADQIAEINLQISKFLPELVIDITARVLSGMRPDRATVERIVTETLDEIAPGSVDVEVALHPDDLAMVEGIDEQLHRKYPGIKFLADPDLSAGDCRAKSRFGTIDARVLTKLQNFGNSLK